jgi:2-polyprenyl-3-methyl-5-hydroxy-6-metoxy-1,4-benzoquinol methylase
MEPVLNKLYDKRERKNPEVDRIFKEILSFAKSHKLECNKLKWFEYAAVLLYSNHKDRCEVLEVGSAKSCFPYFLSSKGYKVTTIDVADDDYRSDKAEEFGINSLNWDLRELNEDLINRFDLISNLSVIEHIDRDTDAILNLGRYLKPDGVMVISTDFYTEYLEYPNANRIIVKDRPKGSHTDSRTYTPQTFEERILNPLEAAGIKRIGATNFENVDINNKSERSVRGLYTFGVSCVRKTSDG